MNSSLLKAAAEQIAEVEQHDLILALGVPLLCVISYYLGKRRGNSNTLIPKSLKLRVHNFHDQAQQLMLQKEQLQRQINSCSRIKLFLFPISCAYCLSCFLYVSCVFSKDFIDLFYQELTWIVLVVVLLFLQFLQSYMSFRMRKADKSLKGTANEAVQIGAQVLALLGPELSDLIKQQIFATEKLNFEKELHRLQEEAAQNLKRQEDRHKATCANLAQRIQDLEQQKEALKGKFQRNPNNHLTAPVVGSEKMAENQRDQKIEAMRRKKRIYKDFISKVVKFKWCQDCEALRQQDWESCVKDYLKFAEQLGQSYREQLQQYEKWKAEARRR